jgi:hypothetical protein
VRGKYAGVTQHVKPWRWNQRAEPGDERANAHGGVTLGLAALVATFCAALLRWKARGASELRRVIVLGVLLVTCVLAMCVTPLGLDLIPFVLQSEARLRQASVTEWMPPLAAEPFALAFWLIAAAFIALLIRRRRLRELTWADCVSIAVSLVLMLLAARSVRQVGPFVLVVTVAISRLLGEDFELRSLQSAIARLVHGRARGILMLSMLTPLLVVAIVAALWSRTRPDWTPMSAAAIQAVRDCPGPLYNSYNNGGFLIWWVPERPVFIDNRQDPFPLSLIMAQRSVETGERSYDDLFARYGIRCAFLSARSKLAARLHADGWQTQFWDKRFAVLEAPR